MGILSRWVEQKRQEASNSTSKSYSDPTNFATPVAARYMGNTGNGPDGQYQYGKPAALVRGAAGQQVMLHENESLFNRGGNVDVVPQEQLAEYERKTGVMGMATGGTITGGISGAFSAEDRSLIDRLTAERTPTGPGMITPEDRSMIDNLTRRAVGIEVPQAQSNVIAGPQSWTMPNQSPTAASNTVDINSVGSAPIYSSAGRSIASPTAQSNTTSFGSSMTPPVTQSNVAGAVNFGAAPPVKAAESPKDVAKIIDSAQSNMVAFGNAPPPPPENIGGPAGAQEVVAGRTTADSFTDPSQYDSYYKAGLDKLQEIVNGGSPAEAAKWQRTLDDLKATNNVEDLTLAMQMAQQGVDPEVAASRLAMQRASGRSTVSQAAAAGRLAQMQSQESAAGALAGQSATGMQVDLARKQTAADQRWKEYDAAISSKDFGRAAQTYKDITGSAIDTKRLEEQYQQQYRGTEAQISSVEASTTDILGRLEMAKKSYADDAGWKVYDNLLANGNFASAAKEFERITGTEMDATRLEETYNLDMRAKELGITAQELDNQSRSLGIDSDKMAVITKMVADNLPFSDVAAKYREFTGKTLTQKQYDNIQATTQWGETSYTRKMANANTLISLGGEANYTAAAKILQSEFPGVAFDFSKAIKAENRETFLTSMDDMSSIAATYGDDYDTALKAMNTSGVMESLRAAGVQTADIRKMYDGMVVNAVDEKIEAVTSSEAFKALSDTEQADVKYLLNQVTFGLAEMEVTRNDAGEITGWKLKDATTGETLDSVPTNPGDEIPDNENVGGSFNTTSQQAAWTSFQDDQGRQDESNVYSEYVWKAFGGTAKTTKELKDQMAEYDPDKMETMFASADNIEKWLNTKDTQGATIQRARERLVSNIATVPKYVDSVDSYRKIGWDEITEKTAASFDEGRGRPPLSEVLPKGWMAEEIFTTSDGKSYVVNNASYNRGTITLEITDLATGKVWKPTMGHISLLP